MTLPVMTAVRAAIIAQLKADTGVQAVMGASPRISERAQQDDAFPFIVISATQSPWDVTPTEATAGRGAEIDLQIHLLGEYEGSKQGEGIFDAVRQCLRATMPSPSGHTMVNLEWRFEDVRSEEDGKRYFGVQRWRVVTEE